MLSHFGFGKVIPGGLGVTIFFFLSGFLISTLMFQEISRTNKVRIKDFYIRRVLRLAPEMLFMMAGTSIIGAIIGHAPSFGDFLSAITYTTNYYIIFLQHLTKSGISGVFWPHLWSLAVEEHFYLIFPALASVSALSRSVLSRVICLTLGACLLWRVAVMQFGLSPEWWEHSYTYLASECRFDSIGYGVLFSVICQSGFRISDRISFVALAVSVVMMAVSLLLRNEFFRETLRYSVQGVSIFLGFAYLYLGRSPRLILKILEMKIVKWGGVLSYGAYLWHVAYLDVAAYVLRVANIAPPSGLPSKLIFCALGFIFAFVIAYVSYTFIAKPAMGLRSRFGGHPTKMEAQEAKL